MVTEGVFTADGMFHPAIWPDEEVLTERFRRRSLLALERVGRLREETRRRFLSWHHSGFSVRATQRVAGGQREQAERLARYATRVVLPGERIEPVGEGRVRIETPPDPSTQATVVEMDEIELVHAICQQVPPARMHLVRYYGAYSNRRRRALRAARESLAGLGRPSLVEGPLEGGGSSAATERDAIEPRRDAAEVFRRASWARLLAKVFEVDPLRCPRCGETMVVVALITDGVTVDRIVRHVRVRELRSVHEASARGPPGEASGAQTQRLSIRRKVAHRLAVRSPRGPRGRPSSSRRASRAGVRRHEDPRSCLGGA